MKRKSSHLRRMTLFSFQIKNKTTEIPAYVVGDELKPFTLKLGEMTDDERDIILKGCLINYNRV